MRASSEMPRMQRLEGCASAADSLIHALFRLTMFTVGAERSAGAAMLHPTTNRIIAQALSGKYQLLCANCNWIKRSENYEERPRMVA